MQTRGNFIISWSEHSNSRNYRKNSKRRPCCRNTILPWGRWLLFFSLVGCNRKFQARNAMDIRLREGLADRSVTSSAYEGWSWFGLRARRLVCPSRFCAGSVQNNIDHETRYIVLIMVFMNEWRNLMGYLHTCTNPAKVDKLDEIRTWDFQLR